MQHLYSATQGLGKTGAANDCSDIEHNRLQNNNYETQSNRLHYAIKLLHAGNNVYMD